MDEKTLERFVSKINKQPKCWLWTASTVNGGYGKFRLDGDLVLAHRVAYDLWRGQIPDDLCVLHKCDTPACVNPVHLFLGTQLDNIADRVAKDRSGRPRGSSNRNTHLIESDVAEIRVRHAAGEGLLVNLAELYGVSQSTIYSIVNRKTWKHIA